MIVSIDSSIGRVVPRHSGDTVLVELNNPSTTLAAVPLSYSVAHGAVPDSGVLSSVPDVWKDTVDLTHNKVCTVTVRAANGMTHSYVIAFAYVIEDHTISSDAGTTNDLFLKGDSLYVANARGVFYSTDGAVSFSKVPGLSGEVTCVYARGNEIYAGTANGLAMSFDGGQSFLTHQFEGLTNGYNFGIVTGVDVQGDTVYVSTRDGVYVSRDKGTSWGRVPKGTFTASGNEDMLCIIARGNMVYAGMYGGYFISYDGGRTFHRTNSFREWYVYCYRLAFQNGEVYAATGAGVAVSTNGGQSFGWAWEQEVMNDVSVEGDVVCGVSGAGMVISRDGGGSYVSYGGQVGATGETAVEIRKDVIYAGFYQKGMVVVMRRR